MPDIDNEPNPYKPSYLTPYEVLQKYKRDREHLTISVATHVKQFFEEASFYSQLSELLDDASKDMRDDPTSIGKKGYEIKRLERLFSVFNFTGSRLFSAKEAEAPIKYFHRLTGITMPSRILCNVRSSQRGGF